MIRSSFITLMTLMLATSLAMVGGVATPAGAVSVEQIESAKTPADQQALAAAYEKEAAEARAEAAKHRAMAKAYESGVAYAKVGHGGKGAMKLHCERLADNYESMAKEAEDLAAFHRQLATQTKK
jgi:hypothetical protein